KPARRTDATTYNCTFVVFVLPDVFLFIDLGGTNFIAGEAGRKTTAAAPINFDLCIAVTTITRFGSRALTFFCTGQLFTAVMGLAVFRRFFRVWVFALSLIEFDRLFCASLALVNTRESACLCSV